MTRWILVVALVTGCGEKKKEEPQPIFTEERPGARRAEPVPDEVTPPVPVTPAVPGSRDVPGERGVPLDRAVLGSFPHPFGALDPIKPTSSRDEILSAVPGARRDARDGIVANVGVDDLVAMIAIDEDDRLDGVTIKLPYNEGAYTLLTEAWGKPTDNHTWFDRKQRWRADWDDATLWIGPFTPLAEVLGPGPEGLTEQKPVIGATLAELQQRFGKRLIEEPDPGIDVPEEAPAAAAETTYRLLLPATEICRYDTMFLIQVRAGRAIGVTITQCFDDEAMRRAALAAFESKWGRAVPGRTSEDLPVFLFTRGQRRFEMSLATDWEPQGAWRIDITGPGGARRR